MSETWEYPVQASVESRRGEKQVIELTGLNGSSGSSSPDSALRVYTCPEGVEAIVEIQIVAATTYNQLRLYLFDPEVDPGNYVGETYYNGTRYNPMFGPSAKSVNTTVYPDSHDADGIELWGKTYSNIYITRKFKMYPRQFLGYQMTSCVDGKIRVAVIEETVG